MCMLFAQKYNMPIGVARPFNNYGPGMKINDKRVPADFAKDIMEGKDVIAIPIYLIIGGILFGLLVGLISGLAPANRAVKISALAAIKQEQ